MSKPLTIAAARSIARYEIRTTAGEVLWRSETGGMFGDFNAPTYELSRVHGTIEKWAVWADGSERHESTVWPGVTKCKHCGYEFYPNEPGQDNCGDCVGE